jgi:small nuclear ribonucleoprotein (snRNP)-like protein
MSKPEKIIETLRHINQDLFSKDLLIIFREFNGTTFCAKTHDFPSLEKYYPNWSDIVHQQAMSCPAEILSDIGLKGLVDHIFKKFSSHITQHVKWTEEISVDQNMNSTLQNIKETISSDTDIKNSCIAYLRLKCILENKSLILSKTQLYIQLNLLCNNVLFYLFYQTVFYIYNRLVTFFQNKKKALDIVLNDTNLKKLSTLQSSVCSDLLSGEELKCDEIKIDLETDPEYVIWPLKLFKSLGNTIEIFIEPVFKDADLETLLATAKAANCYIRNIDELSSKFKDLCKYEFIKSIVFDTDTFTKEDVNIENIDIDSMIEETAVNYLKELLTSENKELVARIRLTQTECDSQKKSAMRKLARKPVSRKSASKKSVSSKPVRKSASRKSVSRKSVSRKRKPAKK